MLRVGVRYSMSEASLDTQYESSNIFSNTAVKSFVFLESSVASEVRIEGIIFSDDITVHPWSMLLP